MERVILIRFGEIFLKGNNKNYFESLLKRNIKQSIKSIDCNFMYSQNRYYIEKYSIDDEDKIIACLKKVFGIHSLSQAIKVKNDIDMIKDAVTDYYVPETGTFRVTTNRADKRFNYSSMEISREIGGVVLEKNPSLTVDLFTPEHIIYIDIRENGYTYIYNDRISGAQGMPVGCSGSGLLMLSGGIDSPVAGYMIARRGMKIDAVHFHSFPYTSEQALDKVIRLAKRMSEYCHQIRLHIVPFTKIQEQIHEHCPAELMITIMRRFMMRISEIISINNGYQAIITGESLGQVASQTIESLTSSNSVVSMPVLRPLIAMDKLDIINIAHKIDTYETSIEPFMDCCTVFLPKNPAIKPKLKYVIDSENALDIDNLIKETVDNIKIEIID